MTAIVGTNDPSLSDHLKAFIKTDDAMVVGIVGEGSSRELTAMWESPFENDTPGSAFSKAGGLVQSGAASAIGIEKGTTSKSTLNTMQVWSGTLPLTFALVLELYAVADPYNEVLAAVIELEKAASPQLNAAKPLGRRPESEIGLCVGRQIIYPDCVITSISKQLDGPVSRDGYPLRAQVNLQLETIATVNSSGIHETFRA